MKRIFFSGTIAGLVLMALSFLALYAFIYLFPGMADEYWEPTFHEESNRLWMYLTHSLIMAITFSWFWHNFKKQIEGSWVFRGIWVGLIYGAVALLPAMWLIFTAIEVSFQIVFSWYVYGVIQACIAGLIFAKTNP